jgi:hypothetical protein
MSDAGPSGMKIALPENKKTERQRQKREKRRENSEESLCSGVCLAVANEPQHMCE